MSERESYILVDIGNKVTRSILVQNEGEGYSITASGESPTTVGPPDMDVTKGIIRSLEEISQKTEETLLSEAGVTPNYSSLFSSDASGGLHMAVTGVIGMISSESAQRAALGAGALLIDQYSKDDGRPPYKKIASMRTMKPDILLMAGGTDGGAISQVLEMVDIVKEADVKPRYGSDYPLPLIFAGNVDLQDRVKALLNDGFVTKMVENVRPLIGKENLGPARESIYDAYMEHVLIHSPGFDKVAGWTKSKILPSQAAVGKMFYAYAMDRGVNLLGVDIGGETTDVYSVYDGEFNRSLNADIGLTYGLSNILKTSGVEKILRWLPGLEERKIRNTIGNMMVQSSSDVSNETKLIQAALAREAISLGLSKHREIATRLKGTLIDRTLGDMFDQAVESSRMDLMKTHVIIGKGSVFNHQTIEDSVQIILDSIQPMGFSEFLLDLEGISPHLGNLLDQNPAAALNLFSSTTSKICTFVAPVGKRKEGLDALRITIESGIKEEVTIGAGELRILPIRERDVEITFTPNQMDLGKGKNRTVTRVVSGGSLGVVIDTRGRPVTGSNKTLGLVPLKTGGSS